MSIFWIYVIVLTVIYIIYYAVMIGMDVTANGKNKNQEAMEISVDGGISDDEEEEPVLVKIDKNSETGFSEGEKTVSEEAEISEDGGVDEFDNDPEINKEETTYGDPFEAEEKRQAAEEALYQSLNESVEGLPDIQRTYQYSYDSAAMQVALAKTDGIKVKVHSRKKQKGGAA